MKRNNGRRSPVSVPGQVSRRASPRRLSPSRHPSRPATIELTYGLTKGSLKSLLKVQDDETDWAQAHPQHAVSEWLGHDIAVSQRLYLRVPEELYAKVSGRQLPQSLPQTDLAGV